MRILTHKEWDFIKPYLPKPKYGGRPRFTNPREVINAIMWLYYSKRSWRSLPIHFPSHHTVSAYYYSWKHVFDKISNALNKRGDQESVENRESWIELSNVFAALLIQTQRK